MNIETQNTKLSLITWISELQDVSLISELDSIKNRRNTQKSFKKQLINQAIEANESIKNGEVISLNDLKIESDNW